MFFKQRKFQDYSLFHKEILLSKVYTDQLIDRYKLPDPRLDLGQKLINLASSSLDISDGLVADLEHICTSSKVGATIYLDSVPLSGAASHLISKQPDLITSAITWGDDYEILFTASPDKENLVEKILSSF